MYNNMFDGDHYVLINADTGYILTVYSCFYYVWGVRLAERSNLPKPRSNSFDRLSLMWNSKGTTACANMNEPLPY
jgi:hypothetical protein